ncbi:MAG: S1 RNA-binding domain-containing protein [Ferruginibacter sp.]
MSNTPITGHVSFVNHEKKYIIIEYEQNGKKKVVNGNVDEKLLKKKHIFHIGDTVSFTVGLSGRGDRMTATNIQFMYNNALDVLINKAKTENNFIGYLKIVDDKYFVKEIDSYLFFPAPLSPWQIKPTEAELNEAVTFALDNVEKKEKITASLFTQKFIPEYYSAERAFKKNEPVEAEVYKITDYGIYLNVLGNKVQAKIPARSANLPEGLKVGDTLKVRITYFSKMKIVVEPAL